MSATFDAEAQTPLLPSDSRSAESTSDSKSERAFQCSRHALQRYLSSSAGHYSVLLLVTLDVSCIFADIFISLFTCERGGGKGWVAAQQGLGIASLVFSCLFMLELCFSVWAFGKRYFESKFHCFDAVVIVTGFVIDVLLKGVLEEVASLIVVLRLWRIFKIVEEFGVGAEEQTEGLQERIEELEKEVAELRKRRGEYAEE